jgi:hypothetical protein
MTEESIPTNPSTPGVTTTPPHPQYQNNCKTNTRRKFTEKPKKEIIKKNELGRNGVHF